MDWMLMPLRRYADFSGRSRRKEYWMFFLGVIIVVMLLFFIESALGLGGMVMGTYGPLTSIFALVLIVPGLAVQVRRFHDQDKTGWLVLLGFIPVVGGLVVLVFMALEGTNGPNKYGPDPKAVAGEAQTFS